MEPLILIMILIIYTIFKIQDIIIGHSTIDRRYTKKTIKDFIMNQNIMSKSKWEHKIKVNKIFRVTKLIKNTNVQDAQ